MSTPWKYDVTILDWSGYASEGARLHLTQDDRIIVSIISSSESGLYDDFFSQEHHITELQSLDGGLSWEPCEGQMPPSEITNSVQTQDGRRLYIGNLSLEGDALREHLESEGLSHLYTPEGHMPYRLYNADIKPELETQGLFVHDAFDGIVAVMPELVLFESTNGGKTWTHSSLEPPLHGAKMVGWPGGQSGGVILDDGTILGPIWGILNPTDPGTHCWISRSTDNGHTWTYHQFPYDAETGVGQMNETFLLILPSGCVLTMSRQRQPDRFNLWTCYSDDNGEAWSELEQVPFWGFPANLLLLHNGDILATYAHRKHPVGVRACSSHDQGRTWDLENEIIIRDDTLPKGIGYPKTVQLSDNTLFTIYAMTKIAGLKPEDQVQYGQKLILHPWFHTFIGGSRYTVDYVRPQGQARTYPEGVFPRRTTPEAGTDAIKDSPQR